MKKIKNTIVGTIILVCIVLIFGAFFGCSDNTENQKKIIGTWIGKTDVRDAEYYLQISENNERITLSMEGAFKQEDGTWNIASRGDTVTVYERSNDFETSEQFDYYTYYSFYENNTANNLCKITIENENQFRLVERASSGTVEYIFTRTELTKNDFLNAHRT